MRRIALLALAIGLFAPFLASAPAHAQATRTWVSGVGDDANPCSRTAPCKTFAGAISKTAAGGEINCLDPGGFGAVTITKALTINCDDTLGSVLVSNSNAIVVNITSGDTHVQLTDIEFDGLLATGTSTSPAGLSVISGANVSCEECRIYGFTNGVSVTGPGARVYLRDSVVRNNATNGVLVQPTSGFATVEVDHTALDSNPTNLNVANSGGTAILTDDTITGGASVTNTGGTVISFGNNAIRPSAAGAITSTTPLQ